MLTLYRFDTDQSGRNDKNFRSFPSPRAYIGGKLGILPNPRGHVESQSLYWGKAWNFSKSLSREGGLEMFPSSRVNIGRKG